MTDQPGDNLLYLLSEKGTMTWFQCRKYMDDLWQNREQNKARDDLQCGEEQKNDWYSMIRKLSSLGYLDIGEYKGKTIVQVAPPMLVAFPFIKSSFFLTGARSPQLLKEIDELCDNHPEIELEKRHIDDDFPESWVIKTCNMEEMEKRFQNLIQDKKLGIQKQPISWQIIEFSANIEEYKKSLQGHWFSADSSDMREVFNVNCLYFPKVNSNSPEITDGNQEFLIKLTHYYSKYYLYSPKKNEKVNVHLDWGRFLMVQNSKTPVIKFTKDMELKSSLRLPPLLERGLALLSGTPVNEIPVNKMALGGSRSSHNGSYNDKSTNTPTGSGRHKEFVFKKVPWEVAKQVSNKLGQQLQKVA